MALFGMCLSKMIIITLTVWNHLFLFACRLQGSLVNAQDATNDFGVSLICSSVFRNIFGSFWHLLLWQEKSHDPIRRHNCYAPLTLETFDFYSKIGMQDESRVPGSKCTLILDFPLLMWVVRATLINLALITCSVLFESLTSTSQSEDIWSLHIIHEKLIQTN